MSLKRILFRGRSEISEMDNIPHGQQERTFVVDDKRPSPTAIIYRSELDVLSRFILDYPNIETGGQLFGFWTATGTPVVLYAIGPGPHSQHNPTSFYQDMDYLNMVGIELHQRYRLQHIGEWHSHHQMDLAYPSGGDLRTMRNGVGIPGFPRILLCIGNCTLRETTVNAFNFHKNTQEEYVHAQWDVVDKDSPYRKLVDEELKHILFHPDTKQASHSKQMLPTERKHFHNLGHWLTENVENVEIMKRIVKEAINKFNDDDVKVVMRDSGEPTISMANGKYQMLLPFGFPEKSPELLMLKCEKNGQSDDDYETVKLDSRWEYPGLNVEEAFSNWLSYLAGTFDK